MLDKSPGLCYYNDRKRENEKGGQKNAVWLLRGPRGRVGSDAGIPAEPRGVSLGASPFLWHFSTDSPEGRPKNYIMLRSKSQEKIERKNAQKSKFPKPYFCVFCQ